MGRLKSYAFIFKGEGFVGEKTFLSSGEFDAIIVGVSQIEDACEVARDLLDLGVELIDLCGAFGHKGAKMVSDAIDGSIRIDYVNGEIPKRN